MNKGTPVIVTDSHGEWRGYAFGRDEEVYFVSETPNGFEQIAVEHQNVRLA